MQTQSEIRKLLAEANLSPQKMFGQNFLIDGNLMGKISELAGLTGKENVLEVGPGTGSLTEELLPLCRKLTAVEIDYGLADLLQSRLGDKENFKLIRGDVLAGKHEIAPEVLAEIAPTARLVSNLPYNIATPLIVLCLMESWKASTGKTGCCFDRLVFTVQRELADRLTANCDSEAYGQVSIFVALLGKTTLGPIVPATAFWPQPNVASRIVRIDFDPAAAEKLRDATILQEVLTMAFSQRRKQIGSITRRGGDRFSPSVLSEALGAARIDISLRPEQIPPNQFLELANYLAKK